MQLLQGLDHKELEEVECQLAEAEDYHQDQREEAEVCHRQGYLEEDEVLCQEQDVERQCQDQAYLVKQLILFLLLPQK